MARQEEYEERKEDFVLIVRHAVLLLFCGRFPVVCFSIPIALQYARLRRLLHVDM